MRFNTATFVALVVLDAISRDAYAFHPMTTARMRSTGRLGTDVSSSSMDTTETTAAEGEATAAAAAAAKTKKEARLRMMKSPKFYRQGFKEVRGRSKAR